MALVIGLIDSEYYRTGKFGFVYMLKFVSIFCNRFKYFMMLQSIGRTLEV